MEAVVIPVSVVAAVGWGGVGFGFVVGMPWRAGIRGVGVVDQLRACCGVSGTA